MKFLALALLRGYKRYLSPMMPTACRYVPTCSDYAMEAIARNGALRGGAQAIGRFLRCNPWGGHGYDPVAGKCEFHGVSRVSYAVSWPARRCFEKISSWREYVARRNGEA